MGGGETYTLERRVSVGLGLVESVSVSLVRLVVRGVILGFSHLWVDSSVSFDGIVPLHSFPTHLNERTWIEERREQQVRYFAASHNFTTYRIISNCLSWHSNHSWRPLKHCSTVTGEENRELSGQR